MSPLHVDEYDKLARRAYLWGLAVAHEDGVRDVLRLLRDELQLPMALAGRASIASIDRTLVRREP